MNTKLLLVDDDIDDIESLTDIILDISTAIKISVAKNGNEMISLLENEEQLPDFIFLDLNMPIKTGFECLTEIRSNEKWKPIKIVILTTSTQREQINEVYKMGADLYIRKPNSYGAFKDMLAKCLQMDWGFEKKVNAFENKDNPINFFDSRLVYNDIVENIALGIIVINFFKDGSFFISYTNKEFHKIAPIDPDKINSENNNQIFESTHPEDLALVQAAIKQLFELKEFDIEFRMIVAGKTKNIRSQGKPIYNKSANCVTAYIYFNDITELVKNQESLKVSEEKYKYMFENAPHPMIVWEFGTLNISDVNKKATELYGYTKEEFIKLNSRQIRPPEDIPLIEALTKNLESYGAEHQKVWRHLKKNGELLYVDVSANIFELNGKLVSVAHNQDVTEKIKAEKELKLMDFAFKKSSTPIMLLLATGEFYSFNDALLNLLGYTKEEFTKMNLLKVATTMDEAGCIKQWDEIREKKSVVFDCHFERKDGVLLNVEVSSNLINYNENEVNFCYINDITEKMRLQQELDNQRLFYEDILNCIPSEIAVFSEDFRYRFINPAALSNPETRKWIIGKTDKEYVAHKKGDNVAVVAERMKVYQEAVDENKTITWEEELKNKSGELIYISRNIYPVFDDVGKVKMVIGYGYDTTNIHLANAKARLFELGFRNIQTPSIIVEINNGRIYDFNEAALNVLGYLTDEFKKINILDLDILVGEEEQIKLNQQIIKLKSLTRYTSFKKKDNTLISVECKLQYLFFEGKELNFVFFTDITQKLKAEEELKQSNQRYEYATLATSDVIWETDLVKKEIFISKNFTTFFGHEVADGWMPIENNIWRENINYDEVQDVLKNQYEILNKTNKDNWVREYKLKRADGSFAIVLDKTFAIKDDHGNVVRMVGAMQDITKEMEAALEKERMMEELLENNLDLKQFSYITTHNLRAPLTNLILICKLISREKIENRSTLKLIEGFKTSTHQLNETLNDLINVLIIKEKTNLTLDELSVEEIIDKVKESISETLSDSKAIVETDFSDMPTVHFTKVYLESIFLNLITNSIKYRHPERNPVLKIKTMKDAVGKTKLTFSDNGIGMDMSSVKHKIFGFHQRFHNNADSKGIGLFLIKSQLNALGGEIEVDSEVNMGTTFTITFK